MNRQPKGTPIGGQFAVGRKPECDSELANPEPRLSKPYNLYGEDVWYASEIPGVGEILESSEGSPHAKNDGRFFICIDDDCEEVCYDTECDECGGITRSISGDTAYDIGLTEDEDATAVELDGVVVAMTRHTSLEET